MKSITRQINVTIHTLEELEKEEQKLCLAALDACKNAYAPYSKFHVGAAVQLENSEIFSGTNQENLAYPSGICAERTALFYANSQRPDVAVKAIAISAVQNSEQTESISPCGSCRQVIAEAQSRYKKPIAILLFGKEGITRFSSASDLLPFAFEAEL